jgi:hypothetical protein
MASIIGACAPLLGEWQLMQWLMKILVGSCAAQSAAAASPMANNLIRPPWSEKIVPVLRGVRAALGRHDRTNGAAV